MRAVRARSGSRSPRRRWRPPPSGWLPAAAQADFGFLPGAAGFNVTATAEGGRTAATLAGSHPYSLVTEVNFNQTGEILRRRPQGPDARPAAGPDRKPDRGPQCSAAEFSTPRASPFETSLSGESCPATTQIGIVTLQTLPRRRRNEDLRRLQPDAAAGRPLAASASPPTACRSRSPRTCAKPTANTASPCDLDELLPAARRDRLPARDLGHPLGDLPQRPARQLPERGRPLLRQRQMLGRRAEALRTRARPT